MKRAGIKFCNSVSKDIHLITIILILPFASKGMHDMRGFV